MEHGVVDPATLLQRRVVRHHADRAIALPKVPHQIVLDRQRVRLSRRPGGDIDRPRDPAEGTTEVPDADRPSILLGAVDPSPPVLRRELGILVVVRRPRGMGHLRRRVEEVAKEQQGGVSFLQLDHSVPRRMTGGVSYGQTRDDLAIRWVEVDEAGLCEARHREPTGEIVRRPMRAEERPVVRVDVIAGVREAGGSVGEGGTARMVAVQASGCGCV